MTDIVIDKKELEKLKKIEESRKKQLNRQNQFIADNYDRVSVTLPKGTKEEIKASGYSINNFINIAVQEKLDKIKLLNSDNEDLPFK